VVGTSADSSDGSSGQRTGALGFDPDESLDASTPLGSKARIRLDKTLWPGVGGYTGPDLYTDSTTWQHLGVSTVGATRVVNPWDSDATDEYNGGFLEDLVEWEFTQFDY
jgi:hypothetical protein